MNLRVAVEADIPEMHRVRMSGRGNVLRDPETIQFEHYRRMLIEDGRGWVCELDRRLVGFAIAALSRMSIWALFVEPGYEGRGIGRRLHEAMRACLFDSGATGLWLSTDPNTRAERFYLGAGWVHADVSPTARRGTNVGVKGG